MVLGPVFKKRSLRPYSVQVNIRKIPIVFSLFCFPQTEKALDFETSKEVQVVTSFAEMGIKDDFTEMGIYQYGFEKPSVIQQRAVVPILQGQDVIAQAQSGTRKTSMIGLTVCQTVDTSSRECVLLNLFSLFLSVLLFFIVFLIRVLFWLWSVV